MRIVISIVSVFLVLLSCSKEEFTIENLNGGQIGILGHGGSGNKSLYPMNSKESVFNSLALGAMGTEMDIQLTGDNALILFHDETLEERTNLSGKVREFELETLEEGHYTGTPYSVYPLVSLREILSDPETADFRFSLDIKLHPLENESEAEYFAAFAEAILGIFNEFSLFDRVSIESQNSDFLLLLKSLSPEFDLYIYPQEFDPGFESAVTHGFKGISIANERITKEQVQEAHDAGVFVILWDTANKKENQEAIEKNPDFIETDDLESLLKLLE